MSQIEELQERFGIRGSVRIEPGRGSLARIVVDTDLAGAEIYLHGGHVTHFQPRGAAPVLFLSKSSHFEANKAIRGGVPLVFPWFGHRQSQPDAPQHGFARLRQWQIESCDARTDGSVRIVLTLPSDEKTLQAWPFAFALRLIVIVSQSLDMTLEVRNTSNESFEFEEALHTYLAVGDVRTASVEGLDGLPYATTVKEVRTGIQPAGPMFFTGETDGVYQHERGILTLRDPSLGRDITVEKEGSRTTVVWNPWIERAKKLPDFGDEEWVSMVCIETANAKEGAVRLDNGGTHRMSSRITVSK